MAGIFQPTSSVPEIRHRTTAARYQAHGRDKRRARSFNLTAKTLAELERLFRHRYGEHLPDDDAGRDDLSIALNYVASLDTRIAWAADWAPWLTHDDAVALAEEITAAPKWLKARALGERLGLTDSERTALGIETIRPIDVTDEALAERTRQKDRERKARERRNRRAAKSAPLTKTKPWEAAGVSRRQWERRRAKAATPHVAKPVRANSYSLIPDRICDTTPAVAGTPSSQISDWRRVDAAGVVGNPDADRQRKTRFPTSMKLSGEILAYAKEAAFEPAKIRLMFEMFKDWNLAAGRYSSDWGADWFGWVDRQVTIDTERHHKRRAQAWFDRRMAA